MVYSHRLSARAFRSEDFRALGDRGRNRRELRERDEGIDRSFAAPAAAFKTGTERRERKYRAPSAFLRSVLPPPREIPQPQDLPRLRPLQLAQATLPPCSRLQAGDQHSSADCRRSALIPPPSPSPPPSHAAAEFSPRALCTVKVNKGRERTSPPPSLPLRATWSRSGCGDGASPLASYIPHIYRDRGAQRHPTAGD